MLDIDPRQRRCSALQTPAEIDPDLKTHSPYWRFIARAIVALFMIRAMIPVGFMPDLDALQNGRIEIVLCSPDGLKTITVDAAGHSTADHPSSDPKQHAGHDVCPFGSVTSQLLALPAALMASIVLHPALSDEAPSSDIRLLPPAHGPPLGSRAPPSSLV